MPAEIPTPQSCTLVGISMEDPVAAVRDPQLAVLMRDGWRVVAHVPAQRSGRTEWMLLLAPPRHDAPVAVTLPPIGVRLLLALVALQVTAVGLLAYSVLGG